ncbi:MAG TPA: hypothetical protein VF543_21960 [Pyrinomonadaceae bacterium]|jgi:hypothetical protein
MIFYVYLDPKVIAVARDSGELGLQTLIGILRGFLQNCFVAEFENHQVQDEIREQIDGLPETFDRTLIKKVMAQMKKHHRFIYCLIPDYTEARDALTCAREQSGDALLDLLLLDEVGEEFAGIEGVEAATLFNYQHTQFEHDRSKLSAEGVALAESAHDQHDLLDRYFKKALRHASRIEICDKLFGQMYRGNYEYTAHVLFEWLERILVDPSNCEITIHCGAPDPEGPARPLDALKADLTSFKSGNLASVRLRLCLYDNDRGGDSLPHDRFIVTDQIALGLPRGMDFLNGATRKNRDFSLDYKSVEQVSDLIASYATSRQPEIEL